MVGILALNVANPPTDRAKDLLEWLWHRPEEVLVLTELGAGPGSELMLAVCRSAGFSVHATDRSSLGVAVVGRDVPVRPEDLSLPDVLPGRVAPVVLGGEPSGIRLLGVYGAASDPVRYASARQRARKREWLAGFDSWLPSWAAGRGGVVIGDLNLVDPQHDSRLPHVLAEETTQYRDLSVRHGLVDAYRLHDPDGVEPSWLDHTGQGCRYDHAFVAPELVDAVLSCDLVHEPRLAGLSDHSALRLQLGSVE